MSDLVYDTSKVTLLGASESANGAQIQIPLAAINAATAILLHKATSEPDEWDEITIELTNTLLVASRDVIIAWGSSAVPTATDSVRFSVPTDSTITAIDRRRLRGGLLVMAYVPAGVIDINVYVEVNRYKAMSSAEK